MLTVSIDLSAVRRARPLWILLLIILLAFGVRLFNLGAQSLWIDETISARLATQSPSQIIRNRANGFHPPTYFLALAGWTTVAGRSEFSLRFLSAWGNVLLIPLLYRACRRLFDDRRTGLLAALLAALTPACVIYSQETRVYALLPVAYLLTITYAFPPAGLKDWRAWLRLTSSEVLCLYLHLFSVFILFAINGLLLIKHLRRSGHKMKQTLRHWSISVAALGFSYLPWMLAVWRWGADVPAKASNRDWRASGPNPGAFYDLIWRFLNQGLLELKDVEVMGHWLSVSTALIVLALLMALILDRQRRKLLLIVGTFVLPLIGAYPVWYMRPLAHPRYLLFLITPLLVLMARSVTTLSRRGTWARAASGVLIGVFLLSNLTALSYAFFDEDYFQLDARRLAASIAQRASPGDLVLMPPKDYSLWYYDPGPAEPVNLPATMGVPGGDLRLREVLSQLEGHPGAFLVTYPGLRSVDPRNRLPFLLEKNGHLTERFAVGHIKVDRYELASERAFPELSPAEASCPPLELTGIYTQAVSGDSAVTAALRWRLMALTQVDYRTTIRLWDGDRQIAAADVRLLNEAGRPTSLWEVGEEASNYYVLPVPLGTPPLSYTLSVKVYGGASRWQTGQEWLPLGPVRLLRSVGQTVDPYGSWGNTTWHTPIAGEVAPGLVLEGYATRPKMLAPGDTLYISLRWRATADDLASYVPSLMLRHDGLTVDQDAGRLFDRYPTGNWAAGELLIETRQLRIPPTLEPLQLAFELDDTILPIGEVAVAREALRWEPPPTARPACACLGEVAELVGYEWRPDGTLTLYWRALVEAPTDTSYSVFTHLLSAKGILLAQHDGLPGKGRRPTTTWLPGEVIVDQHSLQLDDLTTDKASLTVGMYDLTTMERLPARDCEGQPLPNNAIPLPDVKLGDAP